MSKRHYIIISFALFFVFSIGVFIFTVVSVNRTGVHIYTTRTASEETILTGNNSYSKSSTVEALPAGTLINISTADQEELCMLPGIGPSLASAIIEYRTVNGDFKSTGEVMLVPGIAEGKYLAISEYICVG